MSESILNVKSRPDFRNWQPDYDVDARNTRLLELGIGPIQANERLLIMTGSKTWPNEYRGAGGSDFVLSKLFNHWLETGSFEMTADEIEVNPETPVENFAKTKGWNTLLKQKLIAIEKDGGNLKVTLNPTLIEIIPEDAILLRTLRNGAPSVMSEEEEKAQEEESRYFQFFMKPRSPKFINYERYKRIGGKFTQAQYEVIMWSHTPDFATTYTVLFQLARDFPDINFNFYEDFDLIRACGYLLSINGLRDSQNFNKETQLLVQEASKLLGGEKVLTRIKDRDRKNLIHEKQIDVNKPLFYQNIYIPANTNEIRKSGLLRMLEDDF